MPFNSLIFLCFLGAVTGFYWLLPSRFRAGWLILASFIFYYINCQNLLIIILSVLVNFFLGKEIFRSDDDKRKKILLYSGIAFNLLTLIFFKYIAEWLQSFKLLNEIFLIKIPYLSEYSGSINIYPIGISFFTFTNIGYLIDVKKRKTSAENSIGNYFLFICFFPKVIQGPIERAGNFLPQIKKEKVADPVMFSEGFRLILWGFLKKLVIADRIAPAVEEIFGDPSGFSGPTLVFGAVLYSFQIYFDFSSYVDIARGISKLLGYELSQNFNLPYFSKSIKEFWERWHITLSLWLRDYLFLPVAMKLSGKLKEMTYLGIKTEKIIYTIAIIITFTATGIWHGTGWNYLIWGEIFALYLIVGHFTGKKKIKFYKKIGFFQKKFLYDPFQILITFCLITFAWIFFRSDNISNAFTYIRGIPAGWGGLLYGSGLSFFTLSTFSYIDLAIVVLLIPSVLFVEYQVKNSNEIFCRLLKNSILRWSAYYIIVILLIIIGVSESKTFLYSQF